VEVAGRFRSETFPFLSNFDGQTSVVPDLFQAHTELVKLQPPISAPHRLPNVAEETQWFDGHVFISLLLRPTSFPHSLSFVLDPLLFGLLIFLTHAIPSSFVLMIALY